MIKHSLFSSRFFTSRNFAIITFLMPPSHPQFHIFKRIFCGSNHCKKWLWSRTVGWYKQLLIPPWWGASAWREDCPPQGGARAISGDREQPASPLLMAVSGDEMLPGEIRSLRGHHESLLGPRIKVWTLTLIVYFIKLCDLDSQEKERSILK